MEWCNINSAALIVQYGKNAVLITLILNSVTLK